MIFGLGLVVLGSYDAGAIVIPKRPSSPATNSKEAPTPPPSPRQAEPAPQPVSPLLLRRRAAPPARDNVAPIAGSTFSVAQVWALKLLGGRQGDCNGFIRIEQQRDAQSFTGSLQATCNRSADKPSFEQRITIIDSNDGVTVDFLRIAETPNAPSWESMRLLKQGPDKLSGAIAGGGAMTLLLTTALK